MKAPVPVRGRILSAIAKYPRAVWRRHPFDKGPRKSIEGLGIQAKTFKSGMRNCHVGTGNELLALAARNFVHELRYPAACRRRNVHVEEVITYTGQVGIAANDETLYILHVFRFEFSHELCLL